MGFLDKILAYKKKEDKPEQKRKKRVSHKITRNYHYRIELDLDNLKAAVDNAKLPDMPQREMLYIIYDLISKDSHLASQIRTAKQTVQQSGFYVADKSGKESEYLTKLLQRGWFDTFIDLALDAEFWGHSLIEFGHLDMEGQFTETRLIPRLNVIPESGMVVMQIYDDKGIEYRKAITRLALIEVGGKYDLGLLELAAKEVIQKNYARTDWSMASEKYGMPLLKIITETQDEKELDRIESSARNFGSSGYIILGQDDDAEIIADKASDRFKIYQENINLCNDEISKLINGQTMTSDDGSSYSQAQIHERILNDYTIARLRRVQFLINSKLIPFLTFWGYPLEGAKIQYTDLLKKDPDKETTAEKAREDEGKKLNALQSIKNSLEGLPDWLTTM